MSVFIGIMIPFIGTVLGSLTVFFMKDSISKKFENLILGFASGIMVAASIWSLLTPALEINVFKTSVGLVLGILLFFVIDYFMDRRNGTKDNDNLMLAITIHNIPEGMAVGIAFSSMMVGATSLINCYSLAIGIAIQNFPEGSIVSLPLCKNKGFSKSKAFWYGVISAIFELLGALITLLFTNIVSMLMPYLMALASGAMFYVVIVELIPESTSKDRFNVIGFLLGFLIMMILDVML